jgi:hypothetical protein
MMLATTLPSIRSDQGEHILVFGALPGSKVNLHRKESAPDSKAQGKPAKECTSCAQLSVHLSTVEVVKQSR